MVGGYKDNSPPKIHKQTKSLPQKISVPCAVHTGIQMASKLRKNGPSSENPVVQSTKSKGTQQTQARSGSLFTFEGFHLARKRCVTAGGRGLHGPGDGGEGTQLGKALQSSGERVGCQ